MPNPLERLFESRWPTTPSPDDGNPLNNLFPKQKPPSTEPQPAKPEFSTKERAGMALVKGMKGMASGMEAAGRAGLTGLGYLNEPFKRGSALLWEPLKEYEKGNLTLPEALYPWMSRKGMKVVWESLRGKREGGMGSVLTGALPESFARRHPTYTKTLSIAGDLLDPVYWFPVGGAASMVAGKVLPDIGRGLAGRVGEVGRELSQQTAQSLTEAMYSMYGKAFSLPPTEALELTRSERATKEIIGDELSSNLTLDLDAHIRLARENSLSHAQVSRGITEWAKNHKQWIDKLPEELRNGFVTRVEARRVTPVTIREYTNFIEGYLEKVFESATAGEAEKVRRALKREPTPQELVDINGRASIVVHNEFSRVSALPQADRIREIQKLGAGNPRHIDIVMKNNNLLTPDRLKQLETNPYAGPTRGVSEGEPIPATETPKLAPPREPTQTAVKITAEIPMQNIIQGLIKEQKLDLFMEKGHLPSEEVLKEGLRRRGLQHILTGENPELTRAIGDRMKSMRAAVENISKDATPPAWMKSVKGVSRNEIVSIFDKVTHGKILTSHQADVYEKLRMVARDHSMTGYSEIRPHAEAAPLVEHSPPLSPQEEQKAIQHSVVGAYEEMRGRSPVSEDSQFIARNLRRIGMEDAERIRNKNVVLPSGKEVPALAWSDFNKPLQIEGTLVDMKAPLTPEQLDDLLTASPYDAEAKRLAQYIADNEQAADTLRREGGKSALDEHRSVKSGVTPSIIQIERDLDFERAFPFRKREGPSQAFLLEEEHKRLSALRQKFYEQQKKRGAPNPEPDVGRLEEIHGSILSSEDGFISLEGETGVKIIREPKDIGFFRTWVGSPSLWGDVNPIAGDIVKDAIAHREVREEGIAKMGKVYNSVKSLLSRNERKGGFKVGDKYVLEMPHEEVQKLPERQKKSHDILHYEILEPYRKKIVAYLRAHGHNVPDDWGIEEYMPHMGLGPWKIVSKDGPIYFESTNEAVKYVKSLPKEEAAKAIIQRSTRLTEDFAYRLSRKSYGILVNNIKELAGRDEAALFKVLNDAGIRVNTGGRPYAQLLKRTGKLQKFEEDLDRIVPLYIRNTERWMAIDDFRRNATKLLEKVTQPLLKDELKQYIDFVSGRPMKSEIQAERFLTDVLGLRPWQLRRWAGKLNGLQTLTKIGFNLVTPMLHIVQWAPNVIPLVGEKTAMKAIYKFTGGRSQEVSNILKDIGIGSGFSGQPYMTGDLPVAVSPRVWKWYLNKAGMYVFDTALTTMRRLSGLAGYYHATEKLGMPHSKAVEYARDFVRKTYFDMGPEDIQKILRNPLIRPIGQFKTWMIKEVEFFAGLKGKEKLHFLALLYATMGIHALPLSNTINEKVKEWTGTDILYEADKRAPRLSRGIPGLAGVDFSRHGIASDLQEFLPSDPSRLLGPSASMLSSWYAMGRDASRYGWQNVPQKTKEDFIQSTMNVQAMRFWKALKAYEDGGSISNPVKSWQKRYNLSTGDIIKRGLGYTPLRESIARSMDRHIKDEEDSLKKLRSSYENRIITAVTGGRGQDAQAIAREAESQGIQISPSDVSRQINLGKMDILTRRLKTAPPAMRPQIYREIQEMQQQMGGTP